MTASPLYSFSASYRTASGRLTYTHGVVRQLTGETDMAEALYRVLTQSGRRKEITDLRASFFPMEETQHENPRPTR